MPTAGQEIRRSLVVRDGLVTVADLAEFFKVDKSNLLKTIKKLGIPTDKRRSEVARGQYVSVVTKADAERFIRIRDEETLGSGGQVTYIG